MYVYRRTGGDILTVGYFSPNGQFCHESDHSSTQEAAARVHYLNGGVDAEAVGSVASLLCDLLFDINTTVERLVPGGKDG